MTTVIRLRPAHAESLTVLFTVIAADPGAQQFHPHPFTAEQAIAISRHTGADVYVALIDGDVFIGYGMLRGWDAGFEVPSLGIYLRPEARGRGLGRLFIERLHQLAHEAGAACVRLKVYSDNLPARRLYENLGYRFTGADAGQLIGVCKLSR